MAETKRVVYHKDNTFSFISDSKKIRVELNRAGLRCVGGLEELGRFVEEIKSSKGNVKISKRALDALDQIVFFGKFSTHLDHKYSLHYGNGPTWRALGVKEVAIIAEALSVKGF